MDSQNDHRDRRRGGRRGGRTRRRIRPLHPAIQSPGGLRERRRREMALVSAWRCNATHESKEGDEIGGNETKPIVF